MDGLAYGAASRAEQSLAQSQLSRDIIKSARRTEDYFEDLGSATERGGRRGSLLGGALSLLGMAALSSLTGGAAMLPLAKMMIVGGASALGSKTGATRAAKKAGLGGFKEEFFRKDIRRGERDVKRLIGQEALQRGVTGAAFTALPGVQEFAKAMPKDLAGWPRNVTEAKDFLSYVFSLGGS